MGGGLVGLLVVVGLVAASCGTVTSGGAPVASETAPPGTSPERTVTDAGGGRVAGGSSAVRGDGVPGTPAGASVVESDAAGGSPTVLVPGRGSVVTGRDGGRVGAGGGPWVARREGVIVEPVGGGAEGFVAVSAGARCGLRASGELVCWRWGSGEEATVPEGRFVAVDGADGDLCVIHVGGALDCRWWIDHVLYPVHLDRCRSGLEVCEGFEAFSRESPALTGEMFTAVTTGAGSTCALRVDGAVVCGSGERAYPGLVFVDVASGTGFRCGIVVDGRLLCWGDDPYWRIRRASPPSGEFVSVTAGWEHACAVRVDGAVLCWGYDEAGQLAAPDGEFRAVSAGHFFTCGLRADGEVVCWGAETPVPCEAHSFCYGGNIYPEFAPRGPFAALSVGTGRLGPPAICAIRADSGDIVCWNDGTETHRPPIGEFTTLSARGDVTCGVRLGAQAACWGPGAVEWSPPADAFASVTTGAEHACGLRPQGDVVCWGSDSHGMTTPPGGAFADLAAGENYTCGLRPDGDVVCWGSDSHGMTTPPGGAFADLAAGENYTCGLRPDGDVVCWGRERRRPPPEPPPGPFTALSVAGSNVCGLRPTGRAECWGESPRFTGPVDPPPGPFTAISIGKNFMCGLRPGGHVDCWRREVEWWRRGQGIHTTSPNGTFSTITVGEIHACGLRPNRHIECWSPLWPPKAGQPDEP